MNKIASLIKEIKKIHLEKLNKTYVPTSAMTFEQVRALEAVRAYYWKVDDLVWVFNGLLENLLFYNDVELTPFEIQSKVNALINEFQEEFNSLEVMPLEKLLPEQKEIAHKSDYGRLFKDDQGNGYYLGIFTNPFIDLEVDVLTSESHEKFVTKLDNGECELPELWLYHLQGTAFKNRASWYAYVDNFFHMLWPLEDYEYESLDKLFTTYGLDKIGMSHGFDVLEKEDLEGGRYKITDYITFEASLLLKDHAANPYTGGILMQKEFNQEQRDFLAVILDEETVNQLEANTAKLNEQLEQNGVQPVEKSKEETKEEETQEETTTEEPTTEEIPSSDEEPTTEEQPKEEEPTLSDVIEAIHKSSEILKTYNDRITTLEESLKTLTEKQELKAKAEPKFGVLDALLGGSSPLGTNEELTGPVETKDNGHVHSLGMGLVPNSN